MNYEIILKILTPAVVFMYAVWMTIKAVRLEKANSLLAEGIGDLEEMVIESEDYKAMLFAFMSKKFPAGLLLSHEDAGKESIIVLDLPVGTVHYCYSIEQHGELFRHLPVYDRKIELADEFEVKRLLAKMAGPKPPPKTPRHITESKSVETFSVPSTRTRRKQR